MGGLGFLTLPVKGGTAVTRKTSYGLQPCSVAEGGKTQG